MCVCVCVCVGVMEAARRTWEASTTMLETEKVRVVPFSRLTTASVLGSFQVTQ